MPRPRRVSVISLGCAKNLVDTEVMCGTLALAGFELDSQADSADVLLINTCGFIGDATAEAEREIREALAWKRRRRGRRVVVSGCLPQRDPAAARANFPDVDLFLGVDDVPRIGARLAALFAGDSPAVAAPISGAPSYLYDHATPRLQLTPHNYAYVKIAEGCDHKCLFCTIPAIRGRQRSRAMDSVETECRMLLEQGVRELNLIAQDTTRYGLDRDDGATLPELLRRCDRISGKHWLRLLYTHPRHMTDETLAVLAGAAHIVPYIDMPLQHISDRMLRAMGRRMGGADTRALLARLRTVWPPAAVRTTFLVGYPGETEADFEELLAFAREYRFERLGAFVFSPEAGTPAARITDGLVPVPVAEERRARLLEQQQGIALESNQRLIGTTMTVLVEGVIEDGRLLARTTADAPEVDNAVLLDGPPECVQRGLVLARIDRAAAYDLEATVVAPA